MSAAIHSAREEALPAGRLLTFYGDDYTGSSAVMEVLSFAGVPTVLFLGAPTPERIARFKDFRALGVAGVARSQSPDWMAEHLPPVFRQLAALGAPISHYKICSTFDSAPHVGSIGKAIELAEPILGGAWHPLVVGAPALARYQAFGHLFAAIDGTGYRLDRHPVMARHPVTPMHEADVRAHLARQTALPIGLVDFVALKAGQGDARLARELANHARIVALDVLDEETLIAAGRLVWTHRGDRLFTVGSQGLEYALVAYWRAAGLLPRETVANEITPRERIAVVSGSCSPITAGQIAVALDNGFAGIRLDATRAVDAESWAREIGRGVQEALRTLGEGRDPLIFTASGPDDPAVPALNAAIAASGASTGDVNARIGDGLGRALDRVVREGGLARAVISGGDTSGHAGMALGIYAVTALAPLAPGSPLCRAYADDAHDGLEISFKGGQMGTPDFFPAAKGLGANATNHRTRREYGT
ncbi:four-carbon acid sugar kinase family protein [Ancylobacter oerskovii]|uniref:Four-carbon acid sugar kinase family protein n=1 Tax=Ancylobacter oerskovii TaxID=459519 RepID=A0ABW4YZA7_9HYPH|nr:four-carbon acid sugar kinase family protein [Ancylobacter oerskovii]MBS7543846.1 four-carbon acid sugar kinase family protein [Ancylobacter oerskovii]